MKLFSGYHYLLIGISALSLAGCAAPKTAPADGAPKLASVKCKPSSNVSLGTWIAKNCGSSTEAKTVDTKEFLDSMHTPGSIPGKP
jgi:hypothetical protein